jgi:hypothetical protein
MNLEAVKPGIWIAYSTVLVLLLLGSGATRVLINRFPERDYTELRLSRSHLVDHRGADGRRAADRKGRVGRVARGGRRPRTQRIPRPPCCASR